MAELYILRHAHAAIGGAGSDSERPLSEVGRHEAMAVGRHLRRAGVRFDRVTCSPARRAQETWNAVAALLDHEPAVASDPTIYEGDSDTLIRLVAQCGPEIEAMLLVGHNPALHQLAFTLAGTGDAAALDRLVTEYPPGALAHLRLADGWSSMGAGVGELVSFVVPRDLG